MSALSSVSLFIYGSLIIYLSIKFPILYVKGFLEKVIFTNEFVNDLDLPIDQS